jgi:hypothetical protein
MECLGLEEQHQDESEDADDEAEPVFGRLSIPATRA